MAVVHLLSLQSIGGPLEPAGVRYGCLGDGCIEDAGRPYWAARQETQRSLQLGLWCWGGGGGGEGLVDSSWKCGCVFPPEMPFGLTCPFAERALLLMAGGIWGGVRA